MARSMLVYRDGAPAWLGPTCIGTVIGLHGWGADLDQLVPLCRKAANSFHLIAPQAARSITPESHGHSLENRGYTWYFVQDRGHPEPATFGESLWQVEQFICDVQQRQGWRRPIVLLGYDQGAVLALTLAGVMPESLAAVVAICGYLPEIRGWSLPIENTDRLPVLIVHDNQSAQIPRALIENTRDELRRRNAAVELREVAGTQGNPLEAAKVFEEWLLSQITVTRGIT